MTAAQTFQGCLDGTPASVNIGPHGLAAAGRTLAWIDMDAVAVRGHTVQLTMYDEPSATVSMLGPRTDEFLAELAHARGAARRAALLQWTGTPALATFTQAPASAADPPVRIHVFADGFTVEPDHGVPELVPFALVAHIERDGYRITFQRHGLPEVSVRRLGNRTDEFWSVIQKCMTDENVRVAAAFADIDDRLAGLSARNGWAIDSRQAGVFDGALAAAFAAGDRAEEMTGLRRLASGGMRYGISLQPHGPMPFVLAAGRRTTAVEAIDDDAARATYLFDTVDLDAINRALIMLSFRREAVYLAPDKLGRWSLAARMVPAVQWARAVYLRRVVHDENWASAMAGALR